MVMLQYIKYYILITVFIITLNPAVGFSQYQLTNSVFSSGIGKNSSNEYTIRSAAGQTITGKSENESYNSFSGFFFYITAISGINDFTQLLPVQYELQQNYPNPFNPTTTIKYALPKTSVVRITIYNILGQRVMVLINKRMKAGYHSLQFNATGMASGQYFYHMQTDEFNKVKKMLLVK